MESVNKMKRIYLTGYYGQNNLGDDYIFNAVLSNLGEMKDKIELNIEIGNKKFDSSIYD